MSYQLYQGDCLEIMPTLSPQSIDAIICDPPYGIDYQSARRIDKSQWKPKILNDQEPLLGWGELTCLLVRDTGCILVFYRWDVQQAFYGELLGGGWNIKSQIIWNKVAHGMGDLNGEFAPMHENLLFARKPDFRFPGLRPKTIFTCVKVAPEQLVHPNEKPTSLLRDLIKSVTNPGDTVLDFTMGSGSTGVACMETGRNFIGIELDANYFSIAKHRIEAAHRRANGKARKGEEKDFADMPLFS